MSEPTLRKRECRFSAGLPAALHLADGDHDCLAHNLSRSGVLLVGRFPDPPGDEAEVTLRSATGDLAVRFRGRIARIAHDPADDLARVGLQIGEVDEERGRTLDALVARVIEGMFPAMLASLSPGSPLHEIRDALETIPLAHRLTLAARAQLRERELLFKDSNPLVLEALARNPNTTLPEIRALAKVPDLTPSTLDLLSRDQRWADDEELKLQIATHSRVTLEVANRIASSLNQAGRLRLLRKPGLHPAVKAKLVPKASAGRIKSW